MRNVLDMSALDSSPWEDFLSPVVRWAKALFSLFLFIWFGIRTLLTMYVLVCKDRLAYFSLQE